MTLETIMVRVEIDRAAAIRAGKNQHGEVTVPVPATLTPQQRETLLSLPYQSGGHREAAYELLRDSITGSQWSRHEVTLPAIADASDESIALLLDAYPAVLAAFRETKRQVANEKLREEIAEDHFRSYSNAHSWVEYADPEVAEEYQAWRKRAREAIELEDRQNKQRRKEEEAVLNAKMKEEALREKLIIEQWIRNNGSQRLQRLLAENIEHMGVYRDERLALERPGWAWDDGPEDWQEPRNPREAALDLLDEARLSEPAAKLRFYRIKGERDEWEEDEDEEVEDTERGYAVTAQFLGRDVVYGKRVRI